MGDKMGLAARLSLWLHARLSARQHTGLTMPHGTRISTQQQQQHTKPTKTNFFKNPGSFANRSGSAVINPDSTFN
jgi:hypothetical protein